MSVLLVADQITKSFRGLVAVSDVNLIVERGEICSVIGPNGAGKTTLFNLISGVLVPTSGQIIFDGTDMSNVPAWKFVNKGIGRTFQNLALFKHGTVVENILVGLHAQLRSGVLSCAVFVGRTRREERAAREIVEEIVEFLEIEDIRDKVVGTLSYGQQKRVELARALASKPKLLLLDEMVSGMNQEETEDIARFVMDIRDELGTTVLMIEHNMRIVMDISDRIHVLNFGKKIAEGAPREIEHNPDVAEAYFGSKDKDGAARTTHHGERRANAAG
jgi:branched-chain amino acid transport system ATP-binding protein